MNVPPIVSPQEWEAARQELLVREKELTRARDALAAERRRMPRMAVERDYRFDGPDGPASLLDLFEGRRQLIVYRFFFEPGVAGWPASGTARSPSSARATGSSARTSSTRAATRRWAAPGATSTSPRSAARRSGRTRPTATRRPRPTGGGTSTTSTTS